MSPLGGAASQSFIAMRLHLAPIRLGHLYFVLHFPCSFLSWSLLAFSIFPSWIPMLRPSALTNTIVIGPIIPPTPRPLRHAKLRSRRPRLASATPSRRWPPPPAIIRFISSAP